jgi:hypothetical protein
MRLLERVFADSPGPHTTADSWRWKYLAAGPVWDGPRAFVVEDDGAIVAHAGFSPAVFVGPDGATITSLTVTDWAAEPSAPGVGVVLYSHLIRRAETSFLMGGAEITRTIVPKLGFRPLAEATVYARWIRPWREFLGREKNVRALQRLAHGIIHSATEESIDRGAWRTTPVSRFDERVAPVLNFQPLGKSIFRRTVGALNHMLDCPLVRMRGYSLTENDRLRGYAIVAYLGWEARIVDIRIDSERSDEWAWAYGAVASTAREDRSVCRIRAMVAIDVQAQALQRNGFWINQREPFLLFSPKKRLPTLPLDLQYFESDLAFV